MSFRLPRLSILWTSGKTDNMTHSQIFPHPFYLNILCPCRITEGMLKLSYQLPQKIWFSVDLFNHSLKGSLGTPFHHTPYLGVCPIWKWGWERLHESWWSHTGKDGNSFNRKKTIWSLRDHSRDEFYRDSTCHSSSMCKVAPQKLQTNMKTT